MLTFQKNLHKFLEDPPQAVYVIVDVVIDEALRKRRNCLSSRILSEINTFEHGWSPLLGSVGIASWRQQQVFASKGLHHWSRARSNTCEHSGWQPSSCSEWCKHTRVKNKQWVGSRYYLKWHESPQLKYRLLTHSVLRYQFSPSHPASEVERQVVSKQVWELMLLVNATFQRWI